jgi:hypothetical protein
VDLSRSTGSGSDRSCCGGSCTLGEAGEVGTGDATRALSRVGRRKAAAAGETDGMGKVGTCGGLEQICSPS